MNKLNLKWTLIAALALAILGFALTSCGGGTGDTGDTGGSNTTIFVASDIHYMAKDLYDDGEAFLKYSENTNGRNFIYIEEVVNAFAYEIAEKKPDILIISGDLTNNGEKVNHLELAEKLKNIESESGTKVYIIPGNHDILNPFARSFSGDKMIVADKVSPEEFEEIYKEFGYGEAISRDEFSLSYLAAASDDLWLLMMDTNMYYSNEENGAPTTNGVIYEETQDWIRECVEMAHEKGAEVISVTHHNLLKHSENKYYGYTLNKNERVVALYEELGLTLNLSGHIHTQSVVTHEFSKGNINKTIYDIATATMSSYPNRYAILQYKPGKGFTYDTASVDVDGWARSMGQSDENLLNFDEYSKAMYMEGAYKRAYKRLVAEDKYTEEEIQEMLESRGLADVSRFAADYSIEIGL